MSNEGKQTVSKDVPFPRSAAIFGASGGIGAALVNHLIEGGCETVYAGSRSPGGDERSAITPFAFDLTDETSIKNAADLMRSAPPEWVIVASGVLTLEGGKGTRTHSQETRTRRNDGASLPSTQSAQRLLPNMSCR